jgi:hypothetical protein
MEIGGRIINQLFGLRSRGWNEVRMENENWQVDWRSSFWLEVERMD